MFGGFGQTSQPSQQPLFGFNGVSSASTTPAQPTLFGSQPVPQSQPGALNLFGSTTPSSQPTSQPANLFGPGTGTSQQSAPLFGQNTATTGAALLFGSTAPSQPAQTGLFGQTSTPLGSTSTPANNLLSSVSQPKPLFGQTSTAPSATTPAPLNLFGGTTQPSQAPLFGPGLSTTSQAPTGSLFSGAPGLTQQNVVPSAFGSMPPTGKNSPLEQDVQPLFLNLLQTLRTKVKENFEHTSKSSVQIEKDELNESMANAEHFMRTVKSTTNVVFSDAKESVSKVSGDVCSCKELIEINNQKKLHPSQASEQLCQLLLKFGTNLHTKIDKLNDKVYELENPLREYVNWKESGMESPTIGKNELLEHVYRIVEICNLSNMNASTIFNKTEQLKILYMAHLRQLHGNNVKSPFKSEETMVKDSPLFEYDPQRGMKVPNIFPSTTALLSLMNSMQKPIVGQQSTFGATSTFSQPQSTSFFGAQRPAPFSLGSAPALTAGTNSLGTGLFNKPLAATTSVATTTTPSLFSSTTPNTAKPAFQPATPSFGSTLNSSSSGTLFGGSVTKPPSLFGAK